MNKVYTKFIEISKPSQKLGLQRILFDNRYADSEYDTSTTYD